jgi:cytochrome b561
VLKNTESTYGSVAKWLHWLMALWILSAYVIILYVTSGTDERPPPGLNYHKVVGFTILIPLLFRVYWRATNAKPTPPDGTPPWQVRASRASHLLLYFFLFAMPITGYLGNGGGVDYGVFRIPPFGRTRIAAWIFDTFGITYPQWDYFFDTFHYRVVGPYIFWALILAHASAAIYHHRIQKDDVLARMLPQREQKQGAVKPRPA